MEFLHPYYLFGLLAISIPIIIHLFNFRRYKKLYFTNLKFLKSIKNETKKQHRLRHLLILLSRILAIVCLVLAFARPYIPGPGGSQTSADHHVSVYIDNSMSMQATVNGLSLLDVAKARASEVASAYGPSTRFQLLTNDFKGKHQRFYNKDEFINLLAEVDISPHQRMITEVYERMRETQIRNIKSAKHDYFISDFQQSSYGNGIQFPDSTDMIFLIPVIDEAYGNIFIDSCWFDTPYNHVQQHQGLNIRLVNASELDMEQVPVRLMINGIQRALGTFDAPAAGQATINLPFTNNEAGIQSASLQIEDYPITWDDSFYMSWQVKDRIPVLAIHERESGFYFTRLFKNDSVFSYRENAIGMLDYSSFSDADLIVLDNISTLSSGLVSELEKFVTSGGSVLLVPGENADISSFNLFISRTGLGQMMPLDTGQLMITGLNTRHEIFADVFEKIPENLDLPVTRGHYPLRNYRNAYHDMIMELQNGDPYLIMTKYGNGKVYLLTAPLGDAYGNLARHAIWVPLMYRMAMLSRPQEKIYYTMGEDEVINTTLDRIPEENHFMVQMKDADYEFIPAFQNTIGGIELLLYDRISVAGHYKLMDDNEWLMGFAFNYNRMESAPAIYSAEELIELTENQDVANIFVVDSATEQVSGTVSELSQGTTLWRVFIWLALLFILLEILFLRLFRK